MPVTYTTGEITKGKAVKGLALFVRNKFMKQQQERAIQTERQAGKTVTKGQINSMLCFLKIR